MTFEHCTRHSNRKGRVRGPHHCVLEYGHPVLTRRDHVCSCGAVFGSGNDNIKGDARRANEEHARERALRRAGEKRLYWDLVKEDAL